MLFPCLVDPLHEKIGKGILKVQEVNQRKLKMEKKIMFQLEDLRQLEKETYDLRTIMEDAVMKNDLFENDMKQLNIELEDSIILQMMGEEKVAEQIESSNRVRIQIKESELRKQQYDKETNNFIHDRKVCKASIKKAQQNIELLDFKMSGRAMIIGYSV